MRRRHRGLRLAAIIVAGLLFLVLAGAGGSYWWFHSQVSGANERVPAEVEQELATGPPSTLVTPPTPEGQSAGGSAGSPGEDKQGEEEVQDILILGNDTREASISGAGRSDVIMLLHIDRALNFASLLSVPRDLWVDIPGVGKAKINEAYAHGRAALAIKTIKYVLGINVTKYLEIGFVGFEEIIDALGGVYVDVDRHYPPEDVSVPLNAGYQLLNGAQALSFARCRSDQNYDFGRMARQQRVLAGLREQAMGWTLPLKLPGMVRTAFRSTATNLHANEILSLASWLVRLDSRRINQIVITAPTARIGGLSVVVADQEALKEAVRKYLAPPDYARGTSSDEAAAPPSEEAGAPLREEAAAPPVVAAADYRRLSTGDNTEVRAAVIRAATQHPDLEKWRSVQRHVPFPLEAPGYLPESFHFAYVSPEQGTYQIDPNGDSKPAVRMVYRYKTADLYLGVSATTWTEAPLASKGETVDHGGVTYTLVGTSNKVHHIWWVKDGVLYFISNTLMHTVSRDDLLQMATSMTRVDQIGVALAGLR